MDKGIRLLLVAYLLSWAVAAQDRQQTKPEEPPGNDLYVPYIPMPDKTEKQRALQLDNIAQIKILAEIQQAHSRTREEKVQPPDLHSPIHRNWRGE